MDIREKVKVLRSYLGYLFEVPSVQVKERIKECKVEGRNIFIVGDSSEIKQVITYLLVKDGRKNYRVLSSSRIIDVYLGKEEDVPTYRDLVDPALIVVVYKAEMENKRRWELVYQLAVERISMSRGLAVVTQVFTNGDKALFEDLGFKVITFNKKVKTTEDSF